VRDATKTKYAYTSTEHPVHYLPALFNILSEFVLVGSLNEELKADQTDIRGSE
jgi:hypothetical protein